MVEEVDSNEKKSGEDSVDITDVAFDKCWSHQHKGRLDEGGLVWEGS